MNLQEIMQSIPAKARQVIYIVLMAFLVSATFFGWPSGGIGEGIVKFAAALGLTVATANVNRT